ncbi:MAG: NAD(P)/FAD-dependent oxidoreductase [Oscillospiraceae bacterium]|jgi:thioredoxin reductase|nr:NAD(P)/FAD-dependent oxidoreductase [Oscillospiraceae bacterium]
MQAYYDVIVIGAGPAGLAAAIAAAKTGASVLLAEREKRLGGILKQCVHDGFGLVRYEEKLSGPEYAQRFIDALRASTAEVLTQAFVTKIEKNGGRFRLALTTARGMLRLEAKALVFATGCRERSARQIALHGTRPAGVFTAGTAQYYTNVLGQMPARRCVILGSGDIGLIMARRLTLEGARVLGVYEAKPVPSGLPRNIAQCLRDFDIPLHVSHTVTRVFGRERLEAVEVAQVDDNMRPISGTGRKIDCDALILSVGLIPENELAEGLGVTLDPVTQGPICDQNGQTETDGVFACGNAVHVNDLVDYVSESGENAGAAAARYAARERRFALVKTDAQFLYAVPQRIDLAAQPEAVTVYFRTREERGKTRLRVCCNGQVLLQKTFRQLRPPEMERVVLPLKGAALQPSHGIELTMEGLL